MLDRYRWAPVVFALLLGGCGQASGKLASDLPGSVEFPVVAGSVVVPCPAHWIDPGASPERVCVSTPNDANGKSIVDTYKRVLDERGFRFGRYLGGPNVVMLVRVNGDECDVMVFGLPYLPPEQRTNLVLMFELDHSSAEACSQVEREGRS